MDLLTANDAIKSHLDGKKTPCQLDLEVKDRKPSIIPKVGDKVKIKSLEWYKKWSKDELFDFVDVHCVFVPDMSNYCGHVMTVSKVLGDKFYLKEDLGSWNYSLEMFEEVYPVQEQLSSIFPKIDLSSPSLLHSPYEVKGIDTLVVKCSDFAAKVEDVKKRISAYTLVQGLTAKPKLKQIKTTHLIKLKKL